MIKVESVHIEEVRGIREITLDMSGNTFVVYGPNGSGKSGIVDAIEFTLTGEITRLSGSGTSGITVLSHGPHVDKRDYPNQSFVELKIDIPKLGKKAILKRAIKNPKNLIISPDDDDVKAVLAEVAGHPEITLSRREIIKFILAQATKRSQDVQTLLKLDDINQTRATLKTAQNRLGTTNSNATSHLDTSKDSLRRHLDLPKLTSDDLLAVVNKHRKTLGLSEFKKLEDDTSLDDGVVDSGKEETKSKINKKSALADIQALTDEEAAFPELCKVEATAILVDLQTLEEDPALIIALKQNEFVQTGLEMITGPHCPLCDKDWDIEHLKEHLQAKLEKSQEASDLQDKLLNNATEISSNAIRIQGLFNPIETIAKELDAKNFAQELSNWSTALEGVSEDTATVDGLTKLKANLADGWVAAPTKLLQKLSDLKEQVAALPEESSTVVSQTFLTRAQDRMASYRAARRESEKSERAWYAAKDAYGIYCDVSESALSSLYNQVEDDFSSFYREINKDDESEFSAKLSPSQGKLDLSVDFFGRGMFPPGAYHSEGHQDGMGVCLYLALMKRLLGDQFTFAVLDDVVMSVDSQHRKEFCNLLKAQFPNTQFVITTHDQLWAQQMISSGLVQRKNTVSFYGWTIETGPIVCAESDIWDKIDADLKENKVPDAAAKLRRHLEFVSRELAGEIVAHPPFRPDGDNDLGDLLPSVVSRQLKLLGKAASAAHSWENEASMKKATEMKAALSKQYAESNCEQWVVNKALHYNKWGTFSRNDFEPVVDAFNALLEEFHCEKCSSWLYVTPKKGPVDSLRCPCAAVNFNLKPK